MKTSIPRRLCSRKLQVVGNSILVGQVFILFDTAIRHIEGRVGLTQNAMMYFKIFQDIVRILHITKKAILKGKTGYGVVSVKLTQSVKTV